MSSIATTALSRAVAVAGRVGSALGRSVGLGARGGGRVLSSTTRTVATSGRGSATTATRTTAQTSRTVASNPSAANFQSKTGVLERTFNQTFRGTSTIPARQGGSSAPSAFSRSGKNPLSSGSGQASQATQATSRSGGQGSSAFSRSSKNPLSSGGQQGARGAPKTWAGRAKSLAKGTAVNVLPHTIGLLPILLMNQNPLKGLENMLNPANWVQDLSWLGGLLNPANFQQDMTWVENMLKNLGGDVASVFGGMERFAEGAFRDVEAIGKDTVWGVEEVIKWAPYVGGFIALFWVINTVRGK